METDPVMYLNVFEIVQIAAIVLVVIFGCTLVCLAYYRAPWWPCLNR